MIVRKFSAWVLGLWLLPAAGMAGTPAVLETWRDHPVFQGTSITCLAPLEDRLYVGTREHGVIEIVAGKAPARFFGTSEWGAIHGAAVQRGNAWFATGSGLRCIGDPPTSMKAHLARNEEVLGVAAHPARLAWITRTRIHLATDVAVTTEENADMWMAKGSSLVIATSADNLAYGGDGNLVTFAGFSWNHYFMRLKDARVTALAMESDGTIWAGTRNGLVQIPLQKEGFGGARASTRYLGAGGEWGPVSGPDETHVTSLAVLGPGMVAVGLAGRAPALHVTTGSSIEKLELPDLDPLLKDPAGTPRVDFLAARGNQLWVAGPGGLARIDPRVGAMIPRDPFLPVEDGSPATTSGTGIKLHFMKFGDGAVPELPDLTARPHTPRTVAPSRRIGAMGDTNEHPCTRPSMPPPRPPPPSPWNGAAAAALLWLFSAGLIFVRWISGKVDKDLTERIMRADLLADAIDQRMQAIPAAARFFGSSVQDILRLAQEVERQGRLTQELRRCGRAEEAKPMIARMDELVAFLDTLHLSLIRLSANGQHTPEGGWSVLEDRLATLSREIEDIARNLSAGK